MTNTDTRRGNGPMRKVESIEDELRKITAGMIERDQTLPATKEHPALVACRKAAEMVRGVHTAHSEQGETLAKHIEQVGETFLQMCKEAANQIREHRILPEEMANKMADELVEMGRTEAERQGRVSRGLTAARDALLGIDAGEANKHEQGNT